MKLHSTESDQLHCGFEAGTHGDSTWGRKAFVTSISPHERMVLTRWHAIFVFGSLGLMASCALMFYLYAEGDGFTDMLATVSPASIYFYSVAIFSIAMLFGHGWVLRCIAISKVRQRPEKLFDPDTEACLVVEVERANSFHKLKLTADDMGIVCSRNGYVDFELANHHARFPLHELSIAPIPKSRTSAVRVIYDHEYPPWSVVITPIILQKGGIRDALLNTGASHFASWLMKGDARTCRRCKYNLQGAVGQVCPECGAARYVR